MKTIQFHIILIFLLITGCAKSDPLILPHAEKGRVSLTESQIIREPTPLHGEWLFIWGEWADAASPDSAAGTEKIAVTIPAQWTEYIHAKTQKPLPVEGKATVWLRITIEGPDLHQKKIGLRIPSLDTVYAAYWNGKEIARNGYMQKSPSGIKPVYYAPIIAEVDVQKENILVFHLINEVYPRPGLRDKVHIGLLKDLQKQYEMNAYLTFFLAGSLFILGIYHIGLYLLRLKDLSPLLFAIVSLLTMIRLLVTGEGVIYKFTATDWETTTFFEYITFYVTPSVMLAYMISLFPEEKIKYLDYILYVTTALFASFVVFLPVGIYTQTLIYAHVLVSSIIIYILILLVRALLRNRENSVVFLIGFLVLALSVINDMMYSMRIIESVYMAPAGLFLFFFAQAFLLSRRFSIAFRTAEALSTELEQKVRKRTSELESAREQSDRLLQNILPSKVADELKEIGYVMPQFFPEVSVMFVDFSNFTIISQNWDPKDLVYELDVCFRTFDEIIFKHNMEKLKTIGDAYMAACGVPVPRPEHAVLTCEAALRISEFLNRYRENRLSQGVPAWGFRIGINSGPVVAGVIGTHKFAYDIWGDTVNVASRMENHAGEGEINISQAVYEIVKDRFICEYRGEAEVKGKGTLKMYRLIDRKQNSL